MIVPSEETFEGYSDKIERGGVLKAQGPHINQVTIKIIFISEKTNMPQYFRH